MNYRLSSVQSDCAQRPNLGQSAGRAEKAVELAAWNKKIDFQVKKRKKVKRCQLFFVDMSMAELRYVKKRKKKKKRKFG